MAKTYDSAELVLLRATNDRRGRSSSNLHRAVDSGELLRLKPGVFVGTQAWAQALPSLRHRAYAAALAAASPATVFCRATALALYGAPLLEELTTLHIRTALRGKVGRRAPTPLVSASRQQAVNRTLAPTLGPHSARSRRMRAPAVQKLLLPSPMRHDAESEPPAVSLTAVGVVDEQGEPFCVSAEPLPMVLVDTVPRMSRQEAIVLLDAVLAGRYGYGQKVGASALDNAEYALPSRAAARRWRQLRDFANSGSESVGESRSRVLIDELGFLAPALQHEVRLPDIGLARLDFWWEDAGVVGEFDGRVKYSRAQELSGKSVEEVLYAEKLREDALRDLGLRVVRWTWNDLNHPEKLYRKLLAAGIPSDSVAFSDW